MEINKPKISPGRDVVSAGIGVATLGTGFVGAAIKKFFIAEDTSKGAKFLGGLAALMAGPGSLLAYMVAAPGQKTQAEVQSERSKIVNNRYGA